MEYKLKIEKEAKLKQIPTERIVRNPENPRIIFRSEEIESLLLSISQIGIQVPITVYEHRGRYVIIDGERRWKCAKKLNLKTVPALIQKKPTRLQNLLLMFNIHALREQWDILTIAMKLPIIIELLEKEDTEPTERELSKYTGLSQGTIRRSKLLMKLPDKYKDMMLEELKKPKPKQKLTEDYFIEMERGLKTVRSYLPHIVKDINKVREVLIKKYKNNIISNIVDFRDISKIARAENVGVPINKARNALIKLFEDNDYSIDYAFRDSVEWAYDERSFKNRVEWLLDNLQTYEEEIIDSDTLRDILLELREEIDRLLEED